MDPVPVVPQPLWQPPGNWLRRSCRALFQERRLPTRLAESLDRLWLRLGRTTRLVRTAGCQLRVRRLAADPHYVQEVFQQRAYNPPGYEIGPTDTVLDVGGNIGAFAVLAGRQAARGRVLTVEPVAENFRLLCDNLRRNRLDHVQPIQAAVLGIRADEITVYCSAAGSGHHSVIPELAGNLQGSQRVPGLTLEMLFDRFQLERCDFLKMDCEGAEFEILHSLPPELAARIAKLALEYHARSHRPKREQADELIDRLQDCGFQVDIYTDVLDTPRGMIFARYAPAVETA